MKRVILLAIVLVFNVTAYAQVNILYELNYRFETYLSPDAYYCTSRPVYQVTTVITAGKLVDERVIIDYEGNGDIYTVNERLIYTSLPTSFTFSDNFTSGEGTIPSSGINAYTVNWCGAYSSNTQWSFDVITYDFSINHSEEPNSIVCGTKPITLTASVAPQTSYNWYVKSGVGSWVLFKTNAGQEITFTQSELPKGLDLTKTIYFKATTTYEGYAVETTQSSPITFYPEIPTQITVDSISPKCSGGTGSFILSNFRLSDGTPYDASTGTLQLSYTGSDGMRVGPVVINSKAFTIDNLDPGNYSLVIQDTAGYCVTTTLSGTIPSAPAPITFPNAPAITPSQCVGLPATVAATAAGGSGGYVYTLKRSSDGTTVGSSNNTGDFSINATDDYYIEATDINNCKPGKTQSFIINIPDAIAFTATPSAPTGYGKSDGQITVVVQNSGTNVTYEYQLVGLSGWQINNTFAGLAAGAYQVQVRTSASCVSETKEVTITQPNLLKVVISNSIPVSCNGLNDGVIEAIASGGTSGYTYSLFSNFTDVNTSGKFFKLTAGNYTVYVKDSEGNIASVTASVTQPGKINFSVSKTDVTCNGSSDGTVSVNATGGVGGYMYSLDGGPFQSNNLFINVGPGAHDILVRDNNACTAAVAGAVTVNEPVALVLSATATESSCAGMGGIVSLTASGGSGTGYQYKLGAGSYQSSGEFTGLTAGTYTATVKDSRNCTAIKQFTISQQQQKLLLAEEVPRHKDVSCFGGADGRIVVASSGGTGAVKYRVNGSQAENTTGVFDGLSAGIYSITAIDDNNCPVSIEVAISQPNELMFTSDVRRVSCFSGSDGSITITAAGGSEPYKYSINNGVTFQTANIFTGLLAGTYTVTIKDSNNCENSGTASVTQPEPYVLTISNSRNVSCYAGSDGQIQVNATGGTGPYSYSIDGGTVYNLTGLFENLSAGDYNITAIDANGCEKTINTSLSQPLQPLTASFDQITPSYFGARDGVITVAVTGGTSPYNFAINGGAYQSGGSFTGLSAGSYTIAVKDAKGCFIEQTLVLLEPSALTLSVSLQQKISCFGASDGVIQVDVAGGVGPYLYSLNNGTAIADPVFANLAAGSYNIVVTDSKGAAVSKVYTLTQPTAITASYQLTPVSCYNGADGQIEVNAVGGTGLLKFSLNGTDFQSSSIFDGLKQGSYIIYIQDESGCTKTATRTILQPQQLELILQARSSASCIGGSDGSITVQAQGGDGIYRYSIDNSPFQSSGVFEGLKSGLYLLLAEDGKGCSVQQQFELFEPEEIQITGVQDTVLCKGQQVTFTAGNIGSGYLWNSDNGFSSIQSEVTLDQPGSYTLTVTNANGCSATKAFKVDVSTTLLKADFLMASVANAGDTIFVIDVSKPTPSRTKWEMPSEASIIGANASGTIQQVVYNEPGTYTTSMTVSLGECADLIQKSITVLPKGQAKEAKDALGYKEELIKKFILYPNPTSGYFSAMVELSEKKDITLRFIDFSRNKVIELKSEEGGQKYSVEFNHPELAPGVYILTLEVDKEVKTLKIVKI